MRDTIQIGNNQIDKHLKYKDKYKSNLVFWGLGIENELYLEFDNKRKVDINFFLKNHSRERYSVDYFSNYNKEYLEEAFKNYLDNILTDKSLSIIDSNILLNISQLINSHSFLKTDFNNNPKFLYTKDCEKNSKFNGMTLIEYLIETNEYFKNNIGNTWLFDGDVIEFTSNNFYNAKLSNILNEIEIYKNDFIKELNESVKNLYFFKDYGKIKFMEDNYPFAIYLTNNNNISMFNNGTLHYNLTLPTELDDNNKIKDIDKFRYDHSRAIKIIQWMEPFIIAVYGTPDPFSKIPNYKNKEKFSNASQRCAISRYIGIGTYDTDILESGKILTINVEKCDLNKLDYWWYNKYYENNAYTKLNDIGVDINFNKHYNHGIEIRFLDHLSDNEQIFKSFEFIIYLMDYILETGDKINNFDNPIKNKIWNELIVNILKYGKDYQLKDYERAIYCKIFDFNLKKYTVEDIYNEIYFNLIIKYNSFFKNNSFNHVLIPRGAFSLLTLDRQYIDNKILDSYYSSIEESENTNIFLENLGNTLHKKADAFRVKNTKELLEPFLNDDISLEIIQFNLINHNKCCIIS